VVVSDLHLSGRPRGDARVGKLRPLWAGAGTVVFNGDSFSLRAAAAGTWQETVDRISSLCSRDGVRAVFLAGNSDFFLNAPQHLMLAEGRILVTHGDVIFPAISPWGPHVGRLLRARSAAIGKMAPERRRTLEGQLAAARQAQAAYSARRSEQRPGRLSKMMDRLAWPLAVPPRGVRLIRAWRAAPGLAFQFLQQYAPGAKCLILGHTHRPGVWRREDTAVVNTGGFGRLSRPWVVRVEGAGVSVRKVKRRRGEFVPGREIANLTF